MKVWLYYRLSRDEDKELNSLTNQKKILEAYAKEKGFDVIGESFDDNVSGMHFNREGIEQLQDEVEKGSIDAVVVKDLSRLGRHKTQTAMFIDYLRQHRVRVLSVTENIDTDNEDDELMIGFKGIFNDMYCRDISKKIRAGFMQKQREGIVIIPPMGYYKDKNTGQVVIVEEQAEIVRRIYRLYLEGYGLKSIARMLNEEGIKSQGYYQEQLYGKNVGRNKPELARRFLWENTKVRRILTNEFYAGTLVCHKSYTSRINHVRKDIPEAEQFRHEGSVPAIIDRSEWEHVQILLKEKTRKKVRASTGKPFHRYTGLIKCGDCGATFTCVGRHNTDKHGRHEYVCNGYHRYGKENCTSHRIDEEDLDRLIREELISARHQLRKAYTGIEDDVKKWLSSRDNTEKKLKALESRLEKRLEDQKEILLERIRDREHASVYTEMLSECEADISRLGKEIRTLKDHESAVKRVRSEMKDGIALLDEMLDKGEISATSLRLLVEEITIWEKDGKLRIAITLKGNLRHHMDFYDENGNLTEKGFETIAEESDPNEDEEYYEYPDSCAGQEASELAKTA
ncbi:MAG: recombinase family protein [Clostridia bacterium]|nr:recombinase family protein [Clostridia bacterium]